MNFDYKRMIKFEHNVGEKEKKYRLYGGAALFAISIFTASIALLWSAWSLSQPVFQAGALPTQE